MTQDPSERLEAAYYRQQYPVYVGCSIEDRSLISFNVMALMAGRLEDRIILKFGPAITWTIYGTDEGKLNELIITVKQLDFTL